MTLFIDVTLSPPDLVFLNDAVREHYALRPDERVATLRLVMGKTVEGGLQYLILETDGPLSRVYSRQGSRIVEVPQDA